ncbi:hypothetical protein [Myroides injenensis]|uniref:hypothetical protein n=1 Tax=Myroides injenensis TaxID=1183151 RepID=UPI0002887731|nr:hypothetical protein [Myroides injenensis]
MIGWFTNKDKKWEFNNSWLVLLGIFFPFVFPPFAMLYMGILGKIRSLLYGSFLWMILYIGVYLSYFSFGDTNWVRLYAFFTFMGGAVIIAMHLQNFLRRLHLRGIINLKWAVEYDYVDFIRRKGISEILSVSDFIVEMERWQSKIINAEVKGNIATMIQLTKSITKDNQYISNLFLERHAYSIENILNQYYQVELSRIDNEIIHKAEDKLRKTISNATKAFEKELMNQMKFQNLEVDAETEVYIQDLENRGLL